jgi:hypothetical protein
LLIRRRHRADVFATRAEPDHFPRDFTLTLTHERAIYDHAGAESSLLTPPMLVRPAASFGPALQLRRAVLYGTDAV